MNWRIIVSNGRVSEEKYYISGSPATIIVYGQLLPRSWSTTIVRGQRDKGSAIIITISQHDTESGILDPTLRSLIRDPQVIIHDVATAVALDLRTIGQRDSGEEVKSLTCVDEIWISQNRINSFAYKPSKWLSPRCFTVLGKGKKEVAVPFEVLWNRLAGFCWVVQLSCFLKFSCRTLRRGLEVDRAWVARRFPWWDELVAATLLHEELDGKRRC